MKLIKEFPWPQWDINLVFVEGKYNVDLYLVRKLSVGWRVIVKQDVRPKTGSFINNKEASGPSYDGKSLQCKIKYKLLKLLFHMKPNYRTTTVALNVIKINDYIHIFVYSPQRRGKVDKNISDWEIEVILMLILWREWLQTSSRPRSDLVQLLCIFNKGDSNTHKPPQPGMLHYSSVTTPYFTSAVPAARPNCTSVKPRCSEESWLMARTCQRRL